jgi:myo-inositol 2-dehydrogenase / D-chiro-inositol 1-dehydrogenase
MLRVAVLRAERIGKIHAANVAMHRNAKLIAVADSIGDAASSLADLLSCEASQDPVSLIERDDVDAGHALRRPPDTAPCGLRHGALSGRFVSV